MFLYSINNFSGFSSPHSTKPYSTWYQKPIENDISTSSIPNVTATYSTNSNSNISGSSSNFVTSPTAAYAHANPWEAAALHTNTWLEMQNLQHHHNQVGGCFIFCNLEMIKQYHKVHRQLESSFLCCFLQLVHITSFLKSFQTTVLFSPCFSIFKIVIWCFGHAYFGYSLAFSNVKFEVYLKP